MMLKQLGMEVALRVVAENATYWQICAAWAGTGGIPCADKSEGSCSGEYDK